MENTQDKIKTSIEKIRPFLQQDGGDVEFVSYDDGNGIVSVKLLGHCAGCPHRQMTINGLIERVIKEDVPEIDHVEAVQ